MTKHCVQRKKKKMQQDIVRHRLHYINTNRKTRLKQKIRKYYIRNTNLYLETEVKEKLKLL